MKQGYGGSDNDVSSPEVPLSTKVKSPHASTIPQNPNVPIV